MSPVPAASRTWRSAAACAYTSSTTVQTRPGATPVATDELAEPHAGRHPAAGAAGPKGHLCAVRDSSNIESRLNDWTAGQNDMVKAYRLADKKLGPDISCVMAQKVYGYAVSKEENPDERQMGKVTKLGLGYGMGDVKFPFAVRAQAKDPETGRPLIISDAFSGTL